MTLEFSSRQWFYLFIMQSNPRQKIFYVWFINLYCCLSHIFLIFRFITYFFRPSFVGYSFIFYFILRVCFFFISFAALHDLQLTPLVRATCDRKQIMPVHLFCKLFLLFRLFSTERGKFFLYIKKWLICFQNVLFARYKETKIMHTK